MKNDNTDASKTKPTPANTPPAELTNHSAGLRKSWQWTSTELKQALDHWDTMAKEVHGPSPDEKMLQEMQKLLTDLKVMIDSLSK